MFFLVCQNCEKKKKMLSSTCNELTIISYFGKCEYYLCENLMTNYFSIVSFRLYAWETHHSRHGIGKVWETWGYKFASIHHFNSDIAMLHIDETPVKVGI